MANRLTNEIFDDQIKDRPIMRLADITRGIDPIPFKCTITTCNYVWITAPLNISSRRRGCPQCSRRSRMHNNEWADEQIKGRPIKRLGNYNGEHTLIPWECLQLHCGNIWMATPGSIIRRKTGCPECAHKARLFTNENIDELLLDRPIKRLDDYINVRTPIRFQCLIETCGYIWETRPSGIICQGNGCPNCAGNRPWTNELIDEMIKDHPIKRLGECINSITPIPFQCKKCNHAWKAAPNDIFNHSSGCPECARGEGEKILTALLEDNHIPFIYQQRLRLLDAAYPNYILDWYIPEYNCIVELNGRQHYEPVCFGNIPMDQALKKLAKQQDRDRGLEEFCATRNITLIWIDGRNYRSKEGLKQYFADKILPAIRGSKKM